MLGKPYIFLLLSEFTLFIMCIVLLSTAHPAYPFILLSNRDEFISRPTATANWWEPPHEHVLGGRDLERKERGTWLGITKQGRITALTNFREEGAEKVKDKSRGGIINAFLTSPPTQRESPQEFVRRLIHDVGVNDVGGFSMLFGELRPASTKNGSFPGISILSNRSASAESITQIATKIGETHGLSNSHFGDTSWPKVVHGEELLRRAIAIDVESCERGENDERDFIQKLFSVLSVDALPRKEPGEGWDTYVLQMRNSILIPPVAGPSVETHSAPEIATASAETKGMSNLNISEEQHAADVPVGSYGTQKQTVILVDQEGRVVFVERTLYGERGNAITSKDGDRRFEFTIDGWWNESRL